MIKLCKGPPFGADETDNHRPFMITFQYRNLAMNISGYEDKSQEPFLGSELNYKSAVMLCSWLNKCLDLPDNRCDECWDYEMPSKYKVAGEVRCGHCDAVLMEAKHD